jgi:RNA polymerase sigma-70 factor (ECF subfamily)
METPVETRRLIEEARGGDAAAMDRLFELHFPRLTERIGLLMGPQARRVAETVDFAQIVMIDAYRAIGEFEPRGTGSFLAWLISIARNRIADALRRKREESIDTFLLEQQVVTDEPSDCADIDERRELLVDVMLTLGHEEREVITLRDFEGLPFAAIGERLGRSANSAQILHARAMARLGRALRRRGVD